MQKFKNIVALILAALLIVSLAACGGGDKPQGEKPDDPPAVDPQPQTDPEPQKDPEPKGPEVIGVYYNAYAALEPEYYSSLTLYDDGTCVLVENFLEGMATINSTYTETDGKLVVTTDIKEFPTVTFIAVDGNYQLQDTLSSSEKGDYYVKDYSNGPFEVAKYVFKSDATTKEYYPTLTLYSDRTFNLWENIYEGGEIYRGFFGRDDGKLYLYVNYYKILASECETPHNVIEFKESGSNLIIQTKLTMSLKGSKFVPAK